MIETAAEPGGAACTVVIVTRNRPDDLHVAIGSCLAQSVPVEVLVYDDASDRDLAAGVREAFAGRPVRAERLDSPVGYIPLRNRGFREASANVVLSLDDDAYFCRTDAIESAVETLDRHPEAFAVAIPFAERPRPGLVAARPTPLPPEGTTVRNYIGCSHAVHRDEVLAAGGYRESLVHQVEERDLAIRMLAQGRGVVTGQSIGIVHNYSPVRDVGRLNRYGIRNTLLVTGWNAPLPHAAGRIAVDAVQLIRHRFSLRSLPARLATIAGAIATLVRTPGERQPVSAATWRRFRRLPTTGPVIVDKLPEPVGKTTTAVASARQEVAS